MEFLYLVSPTANAKAKRFSDQMEEMKAEI
jgi:hypothetical protein